MPINRYAIAAKFALGSIAVGALLAAASAFWYNSRAFLFLLIPGLAALLFGVLFFPVFRQIARRFDATVSGAEHVARWTLTDAEKDCYLKETFAAETGDPKKTLLTGGIVLAFILGMAKWTFPNELTVGPLLLSGAGISLALALFAFGLPRLRHRRMRDASPDICIGVYGAYAFGRFLAWNGTFLGLRYAFLRDIRLEPFGDQHLLMFHYAQWSAQTLVVTNILRLPVPDNRLAEAQKAARHVAHANGLRWDAAN